MISAMCDIKELSVYKVPAMRGRRAANQKNKKNKP